MLQGELPPSSKWCAYRSQIRLPSPGNTFLRKCLTRIERGQKWHESIGLPLRMCWQGRFFILNQAPSFNLQKIILLHIKGKVAFFPQNGHQIWFFTAEKINILTTARPGMATSGPAMSCTTTSCTPMSCTPTSCTTTHTRPCHVLYALPQN